MNRTMHKTCSFIYRFTHHSTVRVGILFCITLMFVAACGPEETETDSTLLIEQTQRIAQDYQTHQDLTVARSQLDQIEVANSTQWLLFATEKILLENNNPTAMTSLVNLSLDLGMTSGPIQQYAEANGLLPIAVAAENSPVQSTQPVQADAASAEVAAPAPAAQEEAPAPAPTAPPPVEAPPTEPPPTPTVEAKPVAEALDAINVRGGPGTNYNVVGALQSGESAAVTAKNQTGDWWEVLLSSGQTGWVFGQLVRASGTEEIAVAANIPAPPPPTATPVPAPTEPPIVEAQPEPAVPVDSSNPYFTLTRRRLWGKQENDGCVGKHLLRIYVKDAAGNPLNGVVLKGVYVGDEIATGEQGKGDGIMEYDLHGSGEAFTVIRDADGREAGSDQAGGFTTRSIDIDKDTLIATGYCSDSADCDVFYSSYGCHGHHSWEAEFVRNY